MKRFFFAALVLFFTAECGFSLAIGGSVNFQPSFFLDGRKGTASGASFSLKPDGTDVYIEVSTLWNFESGTEGGYFSMSAAADLRLFEAQIIPNVNFFAGAGAKIGAEDLFGDSSFSAAPRASAGLNLVFFDGWLEVFVQQAVQPCARFHSTGGIDFPLEFPIGIGFRIWD